MPENIKDTARRALELSLKYGCQSAKIVTDISTQSSYTVRDDKLDRLHQSTGSSLYLQLYVDERYGCYSSNRTEPGELENFIKNAVAATRLIASDPFRSLPPKELYYKGGKPDLKQYDPSFENISQQEKSQIAFSCACEMYKKDKRIISVNSEFGDSNDYTYMIDSQGFEGESKETLFTISAECSVKDKGDSRPESWWYESSILFENLKREGCGIKAMERALARLQPKKMKSGKYTMVVENTVSSRIISPVISALSGAAIQQNNSFLKDKLHSRVFPSDFYLSDKAHLIGAIGSRYFDGEGIATKEMNIIEAGVINCYFINSYYSKKLDMPITIEGPSVLTCTSDGNFTSGSAEKNLDSILKKTDKGIFVTGFNGGNTNSSTGDFSFGVQGFYYENGVILHPIKEMNVTGNIVSLLNNLIFTGDDPRKSSRWLIPTLAFESVNFSGT